MVMAGNIMSRPGRGCQGQSVAMRGRTTALPARWDDDKDTNAVYRT